jgi:hypothetical protein
MKKSFISFLRKKTLKVYLADVVFFSLLLWFLVYARNRIFSYLVVLQQFAPKLTGIGSDLASDSPLGIAQVDALINVLDPIISEAKFFIFFVIPLMVFLLWFFFQGLGWNLMRHDSFRRVLDIRLYPSFAIASIPFFAVIVFLLNDFLNISESFDSTRHLITWIILFVVFYFTIVSYQVVNQPRFFKRLIYLSVRKAWIFFPVFLLMLVFFLLAFVFLFNAYISVLSLAVPSFLTIVTSLFSILLFSSSKCLLAYLSE